MSLRDFAVAEAIRQGIDPALVLKVGQQESGWRESATSPKGARGPMQLMASTARDMGVNPADPQDNIRGGVKYLKQQLDTFGSPRLALAAYNAGPGAVRRAGGVPNIRETQNYVGKIMGDKGQGSDDIFGFDGTASSPKGPTLDHTASSDDIFADGPTPAPAAVAAPRQVVAPRATGPNPTIAQDAASGFASPFVALGHDVMSEYRRKTANVKPAASLMDAIKGSAADIGGGFRMAGDVLGLASAPAQAIIRPLARGMNRMALPTEAPQLSFRGGLPQLSAPRQLQGDEAQASTEGMLNTALGGARPAVPLSAFVATPTLAKLAKTKTELYKAASDSGFTYAPKDVETLADNVRAKLTQTSGISTGEGLPISQILMRRLDNIVKDPGGATLEALDKLRSDAYKMAVDGGGPESIVGNHLRSEIDKMMDAYNTPFIKQARQANMQWMKATEISNRVRSGELAAASANSGRNVVNAQRAKIRPTIDPLHGSEVTNWTPDEAAAVNRVVMGGKAGNTYREMGNFLRNPMINSGAMMLGGMVGGAAGPVGAGVGGAILPTIMQMFGHGFRGAAQKATAKDIEALTRLIALGGAKQGAAPYPILQLAGKPGPSIGSPAGLTGFAELAAPLARIPSRRQEKQKDTSRAR